MERIFPAAFWEATGNEIESGAELLHRAQERASLRERISSNPECRLLGLVRAVVAGVDAERRMMIRRADFYLNSAHLEFERLAKNTRFTDAMSRRPGGAELFRATASELLLETHVGFVKGYMLVDAAEAGGDRVGRHIAWAERLLPFAGLAAGEQAAVRAWLYGHQIQALENAGKRETALSVYERVLESSSPSAFKESYIECLFALTISELSSGETPEQRQADADLLAESLERLSRSWERVADLPRAFERLAELHRRRIAALTDSEDPGPALAAFQRAIDADPFDLETQAADVRARFALAEWQEQIMKLEADAAAEGKILNEKGQALKQMFRAGFSEAREYLASSEAASVQNAAASLTARRVWRSLDLGTEAGWESRSTELTEAIGAALVDHELEDPAFPGVLAAALAAKPALTALDADAITDALKKRGGAPAPVEARASSVPPVLEQVAPLIPAGQPEPNAVEDFWDWFFSPHGWNTRWAVAVASILLIVAGGLTAYNGKVQADRAALYPRIMAAARENRDDIVIDLAPKYLAPRPLSGRGELDSNVEQAYAKSLVTLIAQSPSRPAPALIQAAQRFSRLASEPQGGRP